MSSVYNDAQKPRLTPRQMRITTAVIIGITIWLAAQTTVAQPILRSVPEIRRLPIPSITNRIEAEITGVILLRPTQNGLFIHDTKEAIYAGTDNSNTIPAHLEIGDIVRIKGYVHPGTFAPYIYAEEVIPTATTRRLPKPKRINFEELHTQDAQYITANGIVQSVKTHANQEIIILTTAKGKVQVFSQGPNIIDLGKTLGKHITVIGVATPEHNKKRRALHTLIRVDANRLAAALTNSIEEPTPFREEDIANLYTFRPQTPNIARVQIKAVVTSVIRNNRLTIQDKTGGCLVEYSEGKNLKPGNQIELLGFPRLRDQQIVIEDAIVTKTANGTRFYAPVQDPTTTDIAERNYDGMRVTMTLRVLNEKEAKERSNRIRCETTNGMETLVSLANYNHALPYIPKGATLRVTGAVLTGLTLTHASRNIVLFPTQPEDIGILSKPFLPSKVTLFWTLLTSCALAATTLASTLFLRRQIKSKTAEIAIARDQALQAAETAEKANRTKSQFLANMSHELRTPLTAIIGNAEAIESGQRGPTTPKQLKATTYILEAAWHLLALINDMLDLTKVEVGCLTLNFQNTSVNSVIGHCLLMNQNQIDRANLTVTQENMERAVYARADETRLRQIINNLLANAIKFTPPGGTIGIRIEPASTPDKVTVTIWDTGLGIAKEDQPKLFQPFVQLQGQLSRPHGGSGLGLVLVKHLLSLQNGTIAVASEPNKGSVFTVNLPRGTENQSQPQQNAPASPNITCATNSSPVKPLILIAEDNHANAELFCTSLNDANFLTIRTTNHNATIAMALSHNPALILMDIHMPGIDGITTIAELRQTKQTKKTPILAFTALAMQGDAEKCIKAGANGYVTKPIRMTELIHKIREHLV